jgi:hypothetical protein
MTLGEALNKCVMIIDNSLPIGLIANTAAVLSLTLGKKIDGIIGSDVSDSSGQIHVGITNIPIPILKASSECIRELRMRIIQEEFSDILVVDFSNAAQMTKNYNDYTEKIAQFGTKELQYLGIALYGDKKKITKLTGNLPLLK